MYSILSLCRHSIVISWLLSQVFCSQSPSSWPAVRTFADGGLADASDGKASALEKRESKGHHNLADNTVRNFPFDPATFSVDWESVDCQGRHQRPSATQPPTVQSSLVTYKGQQYWSCSYPYLDYLGNFQGYVGVLWYLKYNKKHLAFVIFLGPHQTLATGSVCPFTTRDPPVQRLPPPRSHDHTWIKGQPPREPHKKQASALSTNN